MYKCVRMILFGTLFMVSVLTSFASELMVSGRVSNELGIPIGNAEVTFTDSEGIDYSAATDSVGYYTITLPVKTTAVDNEFPQSFTLYPNYPNPFNPSTTLSFQLPERCDISLTVYNALGQHVITLADGEYSSGAHSLAWNGRNADGLPVASGVYVYALETPYGMQNGKMTLLDGGGKSSPGGSGPRVGKMIASSAKIASSTAFDLSIKADGYFDYVETEVEFNTSSEEEIKDAILEINAPRLFCEPGWLKSYMWGGGMVFVQLAAPSDFSDSVEIIAYGDSGLNISCDRTFLSRSHPLSELTIRPDSTLHYSWAIGETRVYNGDILIRAVDNQDIEDIYIQLKIIKELSFEIDPHAPPPDSVLIAFHDAFSDIGFDIDQNWFHYIANQGGYDFDYIYPNVGRFTTYYESPEWHIVKIFYGYPPIPTWYLIRKRGEKSPIAVIETDSKSSFTKLVEIEEFPFDHAFWWPYSWRK